MRPNAILAFSAGYDTQKLAPFVSTWSERVPSARLLIFHTNTNDETIDSLSKFGVEFVDIERYWPSPYKGITLRFLMWRDYMLEFGVQFDKVMVADIRDVIFQSDPFAIHTDKPVVWASEDKSIKSDPQYNLRWLEDLFGSEIVAGFSDQYATCCGTTIGTRKGMLSYLTDLWSLIEATEFDRMGIYEQGFHNYLVHKIKPPYGILDVGFDVLATIGTVSASRIAIRGDLILVDGRVSPLIHQWDRHPNLVKLIEGASVFKRVL